MKHSSATDPERMLYFRVLTAPADPDDFHLQLASLVELAKHGRDLSGFHYGAIPLLTSWLRQAFVVTTAARKKAGRSNRSQKSPLGEETNLSLLFAFIVDVIKFSFNISNEETTGELIDVILYICVHTPLSSDLRACINVLDAAITYGEIPGDKLLDCVKVLCSIHCLVADVRPEAWRSISNLAKSHNGQTTVRILLDILRNPSVDGEYDKQTIREIRGAMSVLEKLFAKDGQHGYPIVPFTSLMEALAKVVNIEHAKVEADVLRLVLSLFTGEDGEVMENVMEEDWSTMFAVVLECSHRARETSTGRLLSNRSRVVSPLSREETSEDNVSTTMAQTLQTIIIRIEELLSNSTGREFYQRDDCISFFVDVHPHLPELCAKLVIEYYVEYRLCYPSDLEWKENIKLLLDAFFRDRTQPTEVRLQSLNAITDVFEVVEMIDDDEDPDCIQSLVNIILEGIGDEKDIPILQELVSFGVGVAETAEEPLFNYVVDAFRSTISSDRLHSPLGSPPASRQGIIGRPTSSTVLHTLVQTPSNVVTKGLVHIFMKTMDKSSSKSVRAFDELLWIAKSHECEIDARISALKMLFRLRADWANRIFLTPFTESDGLAASLYRTPPSLARKQAADDAAQQQNRSSRVEDTASSRLSRSTSINSSNHTQTRQTFRSISGVNRVVLKNHQMWMTPDPEALPEPASDKASTVLCSYDGLEEDYAETTCLTTRTALKIEVFLDTIIGLLQHGCDWEVYSYVLVHLAAQLSNKALFKSATVQIKLLRDTLCEQIKNSSYYEPPISSGLRKVDVAICLFQILTMIISYHDDFTKPEEDELVRIFLIGVGADRAAKCCIHAISICCHELPASTSKSLVTILQKMSTIITQSHVAVHILEFLACLARLPNLYVNFREDEYRTIFMMCFRYLQYVRDQPVSKDSLTRHSTSHARSSGLSGDNPQNLMESNMAESNFQPNASDDLPQYVHALAYHVIIFWFLSLKLTDRAGQVSWITKNLISMDGNGKEKIEEHAQVTLDFMQRVAYADVDESAADPTFTEEQFGEILKKRWIVGQSVVTIEQATRGGWAQITKRQPSGTSCYIIREKFTRPPPHQSQIAADSGTDSNVVLPSHLLLQLAASTPQTSESSRPIPLPDDMTMKRAIASIDRNFTVDGHKVGVIYMGENQTREVDILSNVMGSSDYTHFLSCLGTLTKLKGANFNTQGLDRKDNSDGEYAFCWRDRVTEIVFHVTTQMPTDLERDPQCIKKKSHIGNDFVNIIFNNSGLPFQFDTFPSEFNYVNIVITPESRASFVATRQRSESHMENAFYKVQVMSRPGFPEISPASEVKIVSLAALPGFIRLLALNASVFSLVWYNREGGEHISSWRNRLREINKLREKYGPKSSTSNPNSPTAVPTPASYDTRTVRESLNGLRRSSVANFLINPSDGGSQRSSVLSTAETEVGSGVQEEGIVDTLDFSRWG